MSDLKGSLESTASQKTRRKKKKNPEEHFGSEVDIKIRNLINPAESVDLPAAPQPKVRRRALLIGKKQQHDVVFINISRKKVCENNFS